MELKTLSSRLPAHDAAHPSLDAARLPSLDAARLPSLDATRLVAALLVVVIHFGGMTVGHDPVSLLSQVTDAEVRIATPFFFLLTGYFYPRLVTQGRLRRHLRKLLTMAVLATLFYLVFALFYEYGGDIRALVGEQLTPGCLKRWAVYNWSPGADHLWFFYAVIYDLLLLALADRFGASRLLRWLSVVAMVLLFVSNFTPHYELTRNFLFFGLPFVVMGRSLAEHRLSALVRWFTPRRCIAVALCGIVLTAAEVLVYSLWFTPATPIRECYFGTLITLLPLFLLTLQLRISPSRTVLIRLADYGRRHSANIYIFHFAIGSLILFLLPLNGFFPHLLLAVPVIFSLSVFFSAIIKVTPSRQ